MFASSGGERVPVSLERDASSVMLAVEMVRHDQILRSDHKEDGDRAGSEKVFVISGRARAFVALAILAASVILDPVRGVKAAFKAQSRRMTPPRNFLSTSLRFIQTIWVESLNSLRRYGYGAGMSTKLSTTKGGEC